MASNPVPKLLLSGDTLLSQHAEWRGARLHCSAVCHVLAGTQLMKLSLFDRPDFTSANSTTSPAIIVPSVAFR